MRQRIYSLLLIIASLILCGVLLSLGILILRRNAAIERSPSSVKNTSGIAAPSITAPTDYTTIPQTTALPAATTPATTVLPTTVPQETTVPPTTVPAETVPPETAAPEETTAPPATSPPETEPEPTADPNELIGSLYTRGYLETLDTALNGYGPGKDVDSKNRPIYAIALTEKFKHFDAHFIGPDDGNIYLSFNCGYEYNNLTTAFLDTLSEKNVKAVFFVNYHFVEANPDLIRRIIDEGHILANHCTGHPDLPNLSIDSIVREIMTIHNYVLDTYGYEMKLFRPPSGYYSEQVLAIAQSLGYRTYNFSFSYRDWDEYDLPDPAETLSKLIAKSHSGAIYQLHTVSGTNAQIIGPFIDAMRERGFSFALLP